MVNFIITQIPIDFLKNISKDLDSKNLHRKYTKTEHDNWEFGENFGFDQANYIRYQVIKILEKLKQEEKIDMKTAKKFEIG